MPAAIQERPGAPHPLDLIEAFINTNDLETKTDELASPGALRQWLLGRGLISRSDSVSARQRQQAIQLREALRRAVRNNNAGTTDSRTMRELTSLARRGPLIVDFAADDGLARLDPSVGGFDGALARIVGTVFESMLTGTWARLKGCASDDCQWAFYDASKNRSARWCDMADCGNDAKGRAYRSRRRAKA